MAQIRFGELPINSELDGKALKSVKGGVQITTLAAQVGHASSSTPQLAKVGDAGAYDGTGANYLGMTDGKAASTSGW